MASWTGESRVMRGLPTSCRVGVVRLVYVTLDQSTVTVVSAHAGETTARRTRAAQQQRRESMMAGQGSGRIRITWRRRTRSGHVSLVACRCDEIPHAVNEAVKGALCEEVWPCDDQGVTEASLHRSTLTGLSDMAGLPHCHWPLHWSHTVPVAKAHNGFSALASRVGGCKAHSSTFT